jgi:AraC-like DNA-binding protein
MPGHFRAIPCRTAGIGAVEARSRHAFPPHIHDQYGIGLIVRGAQKSRSGRGMVEAGAGDTITCNPGEVHDGLPIGTDERAWKMLYFEPKLIAEAAASIREGKAGGYEFERPGLTDDRIAGRFRRLFAALTRNAAAEAWCAEEYLLALLADLVRPCGPPAGPAAPAAICRAQARIDEDPAAQIHLSDLARDTGLSRFQLLRGFASATGLTPHAYRIQRRVHLARRLIARGTPLAEAAAASGFSGPEPYDPPVRPNSRNLARRLSGRCRLISRRAISFKTPARRPAFLSG